MNPNKALFDLTWLYSVYVDFGSIYHQIFLMMYLALASQNEIFRKWN